MRTKPVAQRIFLQSRAQRRGPLTPTLSPRSGERETLAIFTAKGPVPRTLS
jgi:hypothetical protein